VRARRAWFDQTSFCVLDRSLAFLVLFDLKDLTAVIIPAIRAHAVRNVQIVAVGTFREILLLEREMTAAAITASFGKFSFWKGRHVVSP